MPTEVIMPKVDMVMDEGTVAQWHRAEGDEVKAGELLFEIETNKATMEVEAPASGTLARVTAPNGTTVPVATVIALILEKGERLDQPTEAPTQSATPQAAVATPQPQAATQVATPGAATAEPRPRATPLARKLVREHALDLATFQGSGLAGRIRKDDVLQAIAAQRSGAPGNDTSPMPAAAVEPPDVDRQKGELVSPSASERGQQLPVMTTVPTTAETGTLVPLTGVRKVIAQRMAVSATIPQFTLSLDVELTAAMQLRERLPFRPSITAIIAWVVAALLPRHPVLNASIREDKIWLHTPVHLGIALDSGGGLLVPVIRDAHQRSLNEITTALSDIRKRGETKQLTPSELQGSTFTISNLGMLGIDHFTALINPPEAAILAVGRSTRRPMEANGEIVWKPMMTLTLSVDHRIADGAAAARFLGDVRATLEEPLLLI